MSQAALISAEELAAAIDRCVVVDCRHELGKPDAGAQAYAAAHIPGAHFLHGDHDLAGPPNGRNGRHPLPDRETFAAKLRSTGLAPGQLLVAYDGGFAARLWWMARWIGHARVAVLDGGIAAWKAAGFPTTAEVPAPRAGGIVAGAPAMPALDVDQVMANLATKAYVVVDARSADRWRGDTEPIDPVAGRIPGALNRFIGANLRPDGRFKPAEVLRAEFDALLAGRPAAQVVHSCGSGVAACHNLLAMEIAGLAGSALYAGSWSEWCADPSRPVGRGPTP
ncbi:MAG: sulfurtransferase [Burkholderiaceae bacterium]